MKIIFNVRLHKRQLMPWRCVPAAMCPRTKLLDNVMRPTLTDVARPCTAHTGEGDTPVGDELTLDPSVGSMGLSKAEKWILVPECLKKSFTFILQQKCKIVYNHTKGFYFWPVYSEVTGRKEGRWAEWAGDTLHISSDCRETESTTTDSYIHATSRKSALTVQCTAVNTWLPRVYPRCVCKQLLEINNYSTTHARWLNWGLFMFPVKDVRQIISGLLFMKELSA